MNVNIEDGHSSVTLGTIYMGVKYHFLDQEKQIISAAVFPQYTTRSDNGFLVPLFVHKAFGKSYFGASFGYFFDVHHRNYFQWGGVGGYNFSDKLQMMAEYFVRYHIRGSKEPDGFVNLGFRKMINRSLYFDGSRRKASHNFPEIGHE